MKLKKNKEKGTCKNSTTATTLINRVIRELREQVLTIWATNQPDLSSLRHSTKQAFNNKTLYGVINNGGNKDFQVVIKERYKRVTPVKKIGGIIVGIKGCKCFETWAYKMLFWERYRERRERKSSTLRERERERDVKKIQWDCIVWEKLRRAANAYGSKEEKE